MADARRFAPSCFFVLRSPLLPYAAFTALGEGLTAASRPEDEAKDRALVRARVAALLGRPEVRDALFLASPSLAERLPAWERAPDSEPGRKVERALMRYLQRMAVRATPFGLFAGCSTGVVGPATSLRVEGLSSLRRYTRLDMHYLSALSENLAAAPWLRRSLRLFPNSSLSGLPGRPRYVEGRIEGPERRRAFHLVGLAPTEYLESTLALAREGRTSGELAEALVGGRVSKEDALAYVDALEESQILVAELEPFVTGPEPLPALIAALSRHPAAAPVVERLEKVRGELLAIDSEGPGAQPARYQAIAASLSDLPAPVELPRLYQADLLRPAPQAALGPEIVATLGRAIRLLARTSPPPREGALSAFRQAFRQRYEDRELPLLEVLDEDLGIGFGNLVELGTDPSPLLDGLDFPAGEAADAAFSKRDALLLRRVQTLRSNILELKEEELDELGYGGAPLPDAFAAVATLAVGGTVILHAVTGPSGALLLGRFCHGDPALLEQVERHLRAEEALRPEVLFAEVVHLPQGRSGNILCRPLLREYELPYLGRSGAPQERQIEASDLLVSVRGERVFLRSRRLGKEIVPRLTTAHNFDDADAGLYRFLCSLQTQDGRALNWTWGALSGSPFLPRVQSANVVLAPASWRLSEEDLEPLAKGAWFRWAQALRTRLRLPRFVLLADYDNRLPVDLDNILSVEAACQLMKERKEAQLLEALPGDVVESPEGFLTNELVVPFVCDGTSAPPPRPATPSFLRPRSFAPGSEWLYLKIYTGVAAADDVLRALPKLVDWFFIRYSDPGFHLRLRVRGDGLSLLPRMNAALEPLRADGRIFRTVLDTYDPEVERYGGDQGVALSERLFCADSDAALAIVRALQGEAAAHARWRLCLLGIDGLFDSFDFDLTSRRKLLLQMRTLYAAEFHATVPFERQLDKKYRAERKSMELLLAGESADELVASARDALSVRRLHISAIARELAAAPLTVPVFELLKSYIHMWTNRMLRSAGRAQELVLYDFLGRLYESRFARALKP